MTHYLPLLAVAMMAFGPAAAQPVGNGRTIDDLVALACEKFLQMRPGTLPPSQEMIVGAETYRLFEFDGIQLTTRAQEREIVDGATVLARDLVRLGVLDLRTIDIANFVIKFGPGQPAPPEARKDSSRPNEQVFLYSSPANELAILSVYVENERVTEMAWSCG